MLNRKGQNIAEYSILIALVIAAAVGMQMYVKRGLQGRLADATDFAPDIGDVTGGTPTEPGQSVIWATKQYEPYYTQSNSVVSSNRTYVEDLGARGQVTKTGMTEGTTRAAASYEAQIWNNTTSR